MTTKSHSFKKFSKKSSCKSSRKYLKENDVKEIILRLAEKLGVIKEFNDVISGKKDTKTLLDEIDLNLIKNRSNNVFDLYLKDYDKNVENDPENAFREVFFSSEKKGFNPKNLDVNISKDINNHLQDKNQVKEIEVREYYFDLGNLSDYKYEGVVESYEFNYEDVNGI